MITLTVPISLTLRAGVDLLSHATCEAVRLVALFLHGDNRDN
jgi:hypothetical protein